MDEDDLIEPKRDFPRTGSPDAWTGWRESRIETRGIRSGRDAGTVSKVSGYINSGKRLIGSVRG